MPARAKFKVEEIAEEKPLVDDKSEELVSKAENIENIIPEVKNATDTPSSAPEEIKDWLKDVKPDVTKDVEKGSSLNIRVVFFVIVLLLIAGAVVGGFFYYKKGMVKNENEDVVKPVPVTIVPSSEVTPTVADKKEVDKKDLKLQVLNGSGKVGEAGVVKNLLVKEGFTSGNFTTGNASSYDFKDTEVSMKSDLPESIFEDIKKSLGDKYSVVKSDNALGSDSKFDISVVVGASK